MARARVEVREVDRGWKQLRSTLKLIKARGTPHVKVGVLDDGAGAADHGGLTTAMLAAILNYGSGDGRIPARPFITGTFEKLRAQYVRELSILVRGIYNGTLTFETVLDIMGARISADMKREVTTGSNFVANAPSTIKAKKSSRPLIDTGRLINAISWVVVTSGEGGKS